MEAVLLSVCYIQEHTEERIIEKEITSGLQSEGTFYGIGFEPEKGEMFWFHKKTEMVEEE